MPRLTPEAPAGPAIPCGPAGPAGPVAPCGPVAPLVPFAPAGPCAPVAPCGPAGPVGPAGPGTDVTSVISVATDIFIVSAPDCTTSKSVVVAVTCSGSSGMVTLAIGAPIRRRPAAVACLRPGDGSSPPARPAGPWRRSTGACTPSSPAPASTYAPAIRRTVRSTRPGA